MKHLWSPWRMKYILQSERPPGCIFCSAVEQDNDFENLIVARGRLAFVILNRFPYTTGHLMVVPYVHRPSLEDLTVETRTEIMDLINHSMAVLRLAYQSPAFNLGANIGAAAGAGVADHFHFHVVPRWPGDSNFMTTVSQTRVLPEMLDETLQRLLGKWNAV